MVWTKANVSKVLSDIASPLEIKDGFQFIEAVGSLNFQI
jgi:hypothetical protein